jgi:hypothetical protein
MRFTEFRLHSLEKYSFLLLKSMRPGNGTNILKCESVAAGCTLSDKNARCPRQSELTRMTLLLLKLIVSGIMIFFSLHRFQLEPPSR